MKLNSYSASRLYIFKQCQMKYYSLYDLKIEKSETNDLTNMGSAVHKVLEISVNAIISRKRKYLWNPLSLLESAFKKYNVPKELLGTAKECVQNAINWGYFDNIDDVLGCEVKIEVELSDGIKVIGYIDRLDYHNGHIDIIDIKTQQNKFTQKELDENYQAMLYNIAIRKIVSDVQSVKVSFWNLRHEIQTIEKTEQDAIIDESKIVSIGAEIISIKEPKTNPSSLCDWCDYKPQCPNEIKEIRTMSARDILKNIRKNREIKAS